MKPIMQQQLLGGTYIVSPTNRLETVGEIKARLSNCRPMTSLTPLFTMDDLKNAYHWISDLRKQYSPNSDIWHLHRDWENIKDGLLAHLNDGSYRFSLLDRYQFDDAIISLWSSQDMIILNLIHLSPCGGTSDNVRTG